MSTEAEEKIAREVDDIADDAEQAAITQSKALGITSDELINRVARELQARTVDD